MVKVNKLGKQLGVSFDQQDFLATEQDLNEINE